MWIFFCSDCKTNLRIYNDCKNIKNRKTLCLDVFPIQLSKNSPQVILKRFTVIRAAWDLIWEKKNSMHHFYLKDIPWLNNN